MEEKRNKWVIFGAGNAGKAALSVLEGKVEFFIDSNRELSGIFNVSGIPVISPAEAKVRLQGKPVVTATADPAQEREMRSMLSGCGAGQIISFSELSHVNPCGEYNYSEILDIIWQQGMRHEYLYHIKEWKDYTSKVLIDPINMICKKYDMQGRKLLDVACGYGFWSLFFALRQMEVLGVDNDSNRLNVFHQLAETHSGLTSLLSDIRDMADLSENSQDVAFCANTLHVVPNWRKVMEEMIRITHNKGHIVLVAARTDSPYIKNLYRDSHRIQWDATCKNIIESVTQGADLTEEIDIYGAEGAIVSKEPTHSVLVFSRR